MDEVLDVAVHLVGERCGLLVLRRAASQIVARSNQALLRLLVRRSVAVSRGDEHSVDPATDYMRSHSITVVVGVVESVTVAESGMVAKAVLMASIGVSWRSLRLAPFGRPLSQVLGSAER